MSLTEILEIVTLYCVCLHTIEGHRRDLALSYHSVCQKSVEPYYTEAHSAHSMRSSADYRVRGKI